MNQAPRRLEAKAETLRAINEAKHKAAGRTHRCEVQIFSAEGGYQRTCVAYIAAADGEIAHLKAVSFAVSKGTKCLSLSAETAVVAHL